MAVSQIFRWISFVAVCLVVAIHLPIGDGDIRAWIDRWIVHGVCQFAVPWFFFASGFWLLGRNIEGFRFTPKWYQILVVKRFRTLMVPFFMANVLWFVPFAVCNWLGMRYFGEPQRVSFSVTGILEGVGLFFPHAPVLKPTWFLRSLFLAIVASPFLLLMIRHSRMAALMLVGGILFLWEFAIPPQGTYWHTVFQWGFSLLGFACFAAGLAVRFWWRTGWIEVGTASGNMLTRNTFGVFLLHVPILLLFSYPLRAAGYWSWAGTALGFCVLWPVMIVLSVLASECLRRKLPVFARLLLGGR